MFSLFPDFDCGLSEITFFDNGVELDAGGTISVLKQKIRDDPTQEFVVRRQNNPSTIGLHPINYIITHNDYPRLTVNYDEEFNSSAFEVNIFPQNFECDEPAPQILPVPLSC